LVIAAFAIERTQEVLKEFNDFIEEKKVPKSPSLPRLHRSRSDVTKIFKHYENMFNAGDASHTVDMVIAFSIFLVYTETESQ
jgi:Cft2 family RNA processing exonuclease